MQLDPGASLANLKFVAEPDDGIPAERVAAVHHRRSMATELCAELTALGLVILDLEQVGEVRAVLHLDRNRQRVVAVVLNGEVLVDAAGDEAIPAAGDRRVLAGADTGRRARDPCRGIVHRPSSEE